MNVFQSNVDEAADGFAQNRADMLAMVDKMRRLEARASAKSEPRRPVFDKRG